VVTWFDYVTVACFLGMAGAFFTLTERQPRTLVHLMLSGIAFGIANQLGNAGYAILGSIVIICGVAYVALVILRK
jgi:nitrate/nitrite transporter NarK